jgi:hypothetical protein
MPARSKLDAADTRALNGTSERIRALLVALRIRSGMKDMYLPGPVRASANHNARHAATRDRLAGELATAKLELSG